MLRHVTCAPLRDLMGASFYLSQAYMFFSVFFLKQNCLNLVTGAG
jgi:hypothetical protein